MNKVVVYKKNYSAIFIKDVSEKKGVSKPFAQGAYHLSPGLVLKQYMSVKQVDRQNLNIINVV